jgi:hypothetical protein
MTLPFGTYHLKRPEIDPVAQKQLEDWERYAKFWVLIPIERETGKIHLVCGGLELHEHDEKPLGPCGISIIPPVETMKIGTTLALVVAHMRNHHREMEGLVYGE